MQRELPLIGGPAAAVQFLTGSIMGPLVQLGRINFGGNGGGCASTSNTRACGGDSGGVSA